jgi:hydrogenase maturation protease
MPEGVCAVDGGTLGLSLLPYIEDARQVVLIDAVRADGPAGSVVRLEGSEIAPAVRDRLSPHQVGVADLLDGAHWLDRFPERLVLLGLVPETLELGLARSPAVEARLDELIECVVEEVRSLGYELVPRGGDEASLSRAAGSAARLFWL